LTKLEPPAILNYKQEVIMSMHLVGPYMTTTKYNSKRKIPQTKKLKAAQEEHERFLEKMGVGKTKLPVDAKGRRVGIYDIPDYKTGPRMTSDRVAGNGTGRDRKVYTGTYVIGAATMHKSNCIPITNKEQAIEVSQMRRS
jgi:hypothetical protein